MEEEKFKEQNVVCSVVRFGRGPMGLQFYITEETELKRQEDGNGRGLL
jgi:hypothetical protein